MRSHQLAKLLLKVRDGELRITIGYGKGDWAGVDEFGISFSNCLNKWENVVRVSVTGVFKDGLATGERGGILIEKAYLDFAGKERVRLPVTSHQLANLLLSEEDGMVKMEEDDVRKPTTVWLQVIGEDDWDEYALECFSSSEEIWLNRHGDFSAWAAGEITEYNG